MDNCIFCQIATGTLPTELIYQDQHVVGFRDLSPQAPTHCLIIPRKHIATINDLQPEDQHLMGHLYQAAKQIAEQEGIQETGYRTVMNCNEDGGQSVYHIHLHLMGGRRMQWPPG